MKIPLDRDNEDYVREEKEKENVVPKEICKFSEFEYSCLDKVK